ncbi:hypothetical protein, partial [Paenibacillus alba]
PKACKNAGFFKQNHVNKGKTCDYAGFIRFFTQQSKKQRECLHNRRNLPTKGHFMSKRMHNCRFSSALKSLIPHKFDNGRAGSKWHICPDICRRQKNTSKHWKQS